jgi:uncharacterized protein YdaU (DUF1376 family)
VNYFELYPGDYLKATQRLTLLEHGVYLRLLMAYYGEEEPLPADLAELNVIVGAISAADKAAVRKVAERFFPVGGDGQRHNDRADAEIAKAQKRIQTARENGAKHKAKSNPERTQRDTQRDTQQLTRSGEALHTPHATFLHEGSQQAPGITNGTTAGLACRLMREAGCVQTNPSHPDLIAALAEGVTPEALADTVREAIAGNVRKPFAYAITTARGRHADGARGVAHEPASARGNGRRLSAVEQVEHAIAERKQREAAAGRVLDA